MERRERLREEVETTLEARRELGAELEPQLVESFLDRVEQRLDERTRAAVPERRDKRPELALAIVSLVLAIPLVFIAGSQEGVPGIALVCVAVVLVNYFFRRE